MNERYGVDYYTQSEEYLTKIKEINNILYGVDWYFQSDEYIDKLKELYNRGYSPNYTYKYKDIIFDSSYEVYFYLYYSEIKRKKSIKRTLQVIF